MKSEHLLSGLFVLLVFGIGAGWYWYRASVQQAVWERQGVHVTTWEVLWGAKPVLTSAATP